MVNIKLVAVTKFKEKYFQDAFNEYVKRLGGFAKVTVTELKDKRISENPSEKEITSALSAEGKDILCSTDGSYRIVLTPEGKKISSEKLAELLVKCQNGGKSELSFIIGSSYGISEEVKRDGDILISMSDMTFPHELARVMIAEQIYRAFTIIGGKKYHK